ncbi:hypothetical protein D3C83_42970 [compost metagenome]
MALGARFDCLRICAIDRPGAGEGRFTSGISSGSAPSEPGTHETPVFSIACFALTLSPISRMLSARGPMKTKPERSTLSAKSAFSARKP